MITLLLEQKEELQMMITRSSNSTDSKIRSFGQDLKAFISTEIVQSQKDMFIYLIDRMKENEECKSLMFQVVMSEFHEQTEIIKQIDSKTSEIKLVTAEIKLDTAEIKLDTAEIKSNKFKVFLEKNKNPKSEFDKNEQPDATESIVDINSVVKSTHPTVTPNDYSLKFNEGKWICTKILSNYLADPAKFDFLLPRLIQIEKMSENGKEFIITPIVSNTNQSIFIPEKQDEQQVKEQLEKSNQN